MYKQKHILQFIDFNPDGDHIFLTLSINDEFTFAHLSLLLKDLHPDSIKIIKREEK